MTGRPPVRVGVIGTGWWSTFAHLPAFAANERCRIAAVADVDLARLDSAARHFGIDRTFADPLELVSSGLVDAVAIATPHDSHARLATAALEAGLHVLVEKPLALDARDAAALAALARRVDRQLVVGYTFQFTPAARRCREIVRSGVLGELVSISVLFGSVVESFLRGRPADYADAFGYPLVSPLPSTYADPRIAGGGQGQTQATHAAAMLFHVTGARAVEVSALVDTDGSEIELALSASFRLDDGAIGALVSTGSLRPGQPPQERLTYFGTNGFAVHDLALGTLEVNGNDGSVELIAASADTDIYPLGAPADTLVDLALGSTANPAPPEDAVAAVELIEAAYRSARTGSAVSIASLYGEASAGAA